MKKIIFIGFVLVFFLHGAAFTQPAKLRVITTLNYLKYVVEQVGGDFVDVAALANPRQDPHYVTPTPGMNRLASIADLFIENGISLDIWAKNVIDASGNPKIQSGSQGHLIATINVPIKELPTEVSRSWGDIHPQGNPHIWLDPLNIKIVATNIADRLTVLDPTNGPYYQKRAEEFRERLDVALFGEDLIRELGKRAGDVLSRKAKNNELESWLRSKNLDHKLGGWLKKAEVLKNAGVISYHKTYTYFTDRFGLVIRGELEDKPGIPPPPQHRDAIIDQIKREGLKVILNDNFYSTEAAEYVAGKTQAKVIITYLDVGASEDVDTYEKLITYLIEKISQAL